MPERIGAHLTDSGTEFRVWAPFAKSVEVLLPQAVSLTKEERGYFKAHVPGIKKDQLYKFRLDSGEELPDPASRFQPEGVHGPSSVIDSRFPWTDQEWKGIDLEDFVIYELHVGTFTSEGTFAAIKKHLSRLQDLGINAIELMPIGQFPGKRNWGYDGVHLFAPQNSYARGNSPEELKDLINECHRRGLAVLLDVVYNHLGPEGNHLSKWGPYFQDKYKTPWGNALNFDGPGSDEVRNYFLANVRQWIEEYHFDGLRFDAIHAIIDTSAYNFLSEISDFVQSLKVQLQRKIWLIAESDGNDPRVLAPTANGGYGMDAQWADDFHHCLHALLTKENQGYYGDYGSPEHLAEVFKKGTYFSGQYSKFRDRRHGKIFSKEHRTHLVVCTQNHDQIGNRAHGDRLSSLVDDKKLKAAAIWMFLSGGLPLIFMGEEVGDKHPFQYFVDHGDEKLMTAVREGRRKEFSSFTWEGEIPDPSSQASFENSHPDWTAIGTARAMEFSSLYKNLIQLSKTLRKSHVLESPEMQVNLVNERNVLQVLVPGTFEMWASLSEEEQEVLRQEPHLPLLFSSAEVKETERKIKLPSFGVAVFYE